MAASGMPRPPGGSQGTSFWGKEEGKAGARLAQTPAPVPQRGEKGCRERESGGRRQALEKEEAVGLAEGTRALPATPRLFWDQVANDRLWLEARLAYRGRKRTSRDIILL